MCENIEIGVAEGSGIYSTTIDSTTTDEGGYTTPTDTTLDMGTTTDEGGYTPPANPAPDAGTTTEDDGVHSDSENPGVDVNGSKKPSTEPEEDDDGVHDDPENPSGDMNDSSKTSTTCMPVVTLEEPSPNFTVWVKEGESTTITIRAKGSNCVKMTAYVNGNEVGSANGNYLSCSYATNKVGIYSILVVGTSSAGCTDSATVKVTVKDTYTVSYDLNDGEGTTPDPEEPVKIGSNVALAIVKNPEDCYMLDHTFDGWGLCPEGTDEPFKQGETVKFDSDVTLYAQFTYAVDRE